MPFKSKAQAKWMFSNKPEMAKEWASHTNMKKTPKKAAGKAMKAKKMEKAAEKMMFGGKYSK